MKKVAGEPINSGLVFFFFFTKARRLSHGVPSRSVITMVEFDNNVCLSVISF